MTKNVADYEALFYGGGADAKYTALKAYADAHVTAIDLLGGIGGGGGGTGDVTTAELDDAVDALTAIDADLAADVAAEAAARAAADAAVGNDIAAVIDRITDLEDTTTGPEGQNGISLLHFGQAGDHDDVVTGLTSRSWTLPVDFNLVWSSSTLAGDAGSGTTVVDVQLDTGSGFASIFTSSPETRLLIPASARVSNKATPTTTFAPAGSRIRSQVVTAPTLGGSLSYVGAASAGDGLTAHTSSTNIPIHASTAADDLMIATAFTSATSISWPAGWTPLGAPVPIGSSTGPMWMYVATKVASASESTTQAVPHSTIPFVMETDTIRSGTFQTISAGLVNVTAVQTGSTPTDISTTVANSLVIHKAGIRLASGLQPVTPVWSNSLVTDAKAMGAVAAATNFGIYSTHETKAAAGALPGRTFSWSTNSGRIAATSIIVAPTAGQVAEGLLTTVGMREA